MSAYVAPLKDMRFVLQELAGLDAVAKLPGCEEAVPETVDALTVAAATLTDRWPATSPRTTTTTT